jgi:hypothetical protein
MQRFGVGRVRIELEQLRLHVGEMLFGLFEEHRQEAGQVDGHGGSLAGRDNRR